MGTVVITKTAGRTRFAVELASFYGCDRVVEDWRLGDGQDIAGALVIESPRGPLREAVCTADQYVCLDLALTRLAHNDPLWHPAGASFVSDRITPEDRAEIAHASEVARTVRSAENQRATDRAYAVLKPGDRLLVSGCGGTRATVTMTGWTGWNGTDPKPYWITSKSRDDIHATHILKVNGKPVCFRDPLDES